MSIWLENKSEHLPLRVDKTGQETVLIMISFIAIIYLLTTFIASYPEIDDANFDCT